MAESRKIEQRTFFEVEAPLISTKIHLYGASAQALVGSVVVLDLTKSLRGKSLLLKLRVHLNGESLVGEPERLELAGSYLRRAIRKGTDYVEDSFSLECKDSSLIIKPFLLTRNKVSRSVRKALREACRKQIEAHCKNRPTLEIFSEIMANKLQKEMSIKLRKIYPLALCEIRWLEVVKEKK